MGSLPPSAAPAKTFLLAPLEAILVLERERLLSHEVSVESPLRRQPGVCDIPVPVLWDTRALPETVVTESGKGLGAPRFLFLARKTPSFDSHTAVQRVIAAGGLFVGHETYVGRALEKEGLPSEWIDEVLAHPNVLHVNAPDLAFRRLLRKASGVADASATTVAITGTNGKTSTTQIAGSALAILAGGPVLRLGTLGIELGEDRFEGDTPTMPDYPAFLAAARLASERGSRHIVMEATSQGLHQGRLGEWLCDVVVFTNLTQDHLDYHGTMEAYAAAKQILFEDHVKFGGTAVVNAADPLWAEFADKAAHPQRHVVGFGPPGQAEAFFQRVGRAFLSVRYLSIAQRISHTSGIRGVWSIAGERQTFAEVPFALGLVGNFQHDNAAAAAAALVALGYPLAQVAQALGAARLIPGRLEPVRLPHAGNHVDHAGAQASAQAPAHASGQDGLPTVLVDYAHTPDALEKALHTCRQILRPGGRLVCVFGCGGDRDPTKRPIMGRIAAESADVCYVTSDNPRTEDPGAIITDIVAGVPAGAMDKIKVNAERSRAIAEAVEAASSADLVLVAGKGHEDYQILGTTKHPFSDVAEAAKALTARASRK